MQRSQRLMNHLIDALATESSQRFSVKPWSCASPRQISLCSRSGQTKVTCLAASRPFVSVLTFGIPYCTVLQAQALVHVISVRLRASSTVFIPIYVEGLARQAKLDRSLLFQFEVRLSVNTTDGRSPLCEVSGPPSGEVDLAFLECELPPAQRLPGAWILMFRWIQGPAFGHVYAIPLQMCLEPTYRMRPCDSIAQSARATTQSDRPRIGACISTLSDQHNTLSLGHIIPFVEYYRIAGVHHMVLNMRPEVYIEFAPLLRELYAKEAPGFILDVTNVGYVVREPFLVIEKNYKDQVAVLNSCLARMTDHVDWLGFVRQRGSVAEIAINSAL
jgi:hypothetical protein